MPEHFIHLLSGETLSLDGLIFKLKYFPFDTKFRIFSLFLKLEKKKKDMFSVVLFSLIMLGTRQCLSSEKLKYSAC